MTEADALSQLQEFLSFYPDDVQEIAMECRRILLERVGPATEIFWDATNAVCLGFSYTDNVSENFINLAVYPKHVTLIFPNGVKHDDPHRVLRGEGNRVRNIRLTGPETLSLPSVRDHIMQAKEIAFRGEEQEFGFIVKVMNGPKKRPSPL
ncbi:MAG: hypothetical protein ABL921_35330 [Pirellula sp.]